MSEHYGRKREEVYRWLLILFSLVSVAGIFLIAIFIFVQGWPALKETGIANFIFGKEWKGTDYVFGIWPMIVGSVYVTLTSLIIGVPIGLATAIFMAEIAPEKIVKILRPAIELLAGIPSVVYGLFGLVVVVPLVRNIAKFIYRESITADVQSGFSVLAAGIILAIMILPTIISIAEDSLRTVPKEYKEGSLALGASHWHTIKKVTVPAAASGILAGIILGMGRALGETMAVIMVAGNAPIIPHSVFSKTRTLTSNIAIEMGYSVGLHTSALFATGIVLFIMIMLINYLARVIIRRGGITHE